MYMSKHTIQIRVPCDNRHIGTCVLAFCFYLLSYFVNYLEGIEIIVLMCLLHLSVHCTTISGPFLYVSTSPLFYFLDLQAVGIFLQLVTHNHTSEGGGNFQKLCSQCRTGVKSVSAVA